jgi:hypothetical protein
MTLYTSRPRTECAIQTSSWWPGTKHCSLRRPPTGCPLQPLGERSRAAIHEPVDPHHPRRCAVLYDGIARSGRCSGPDAGDEVLGADDGTRTRDPHLGNATVAGVLPGTFGLVGHGVLCVLSLPGTDFGHKVARGGHPEQPVPLRTTRWSAVMPRYQKKPPPSSSTAPAHVDGPLCKDRHHPRRRVDLRAPVLAADRPAVRSPLPGRERWSTASAANHPSAASTTSPGTTASCPRT